VNFIQIISEDVDLKTGVKTLQREALMVQRVIALPSLIKREHFYDLAWITGNKEFTYGGDVLTDNRKFIVDRKDLGDWIIKEAQVMIYGGKQYAVQEVTEFEEKLAYLVVARESEGRDLNNILQFSLYDELNLVDAAAPDAPINISLTDNLGLSDEAVAS
jgi:hypothetical protein